MSQKIIVSKPTFDATTETNPDNLIFSSDYNTLKYYASGNAPITINGNGATQSSQIVLAHNLGYVPFFVCFVNNGSAYFPAPREEQTVAPNTTLYASAYADATNLYLVLTTNFAIGNLASVNFYFKLYKNNLGF